ncbi:MAG: DUF4139 domain-containing protein [Anaerohalosphaeraceae bacterium]|nr:DUF4139 domain-containing protein [Anaerohalosphaeraceae bacterium]
MKVAMLLICCACFVCPVYGLDDDMSAQNQSMAITVYNEDFAVVKERRYMSFASGINTLKFTDVASAIEPASVNFKCLSPSNAISILEQNYEYDLVNTESLLKKYIDKYVSVEVKGSGSDSGRKIKGILSASVGGDLIIQRSGGGVDIIRRNSIESISLDELSEGLVTKPTLVWLANAKSAGNELCQITYTTGRVGWGADYSATLNASETALDLTGWVTIDNKSGATYKDATIKLIAGDVRRVKPRRQMFDERSIVRGLGMEAKSAPFEEKSFMEYHLYTLGRKSTINNNQTKQLEFITPAMNVPAKKVYIYERTKKADKVQIKIEFENKKEFGLGIALPKGKVRVFKNDPADDSLEFVGEDMIDHTPRKEKISLYIGDAFDIAVEYKPLDSKVSRRMRWDKHQIELRNRKDTPVTVFVDEKFSSWVNWDIEQSSLEYEKYDANTARFKVRLAADSTVTLEYSANQNW